MILILEVFHHKTFIKNGTQQDLDLISEALTVFKQKFTVSQYQDPEWEITHLLSYRDFSFPTAYLKETLKFCDEKLIRYSVSDKRKYPSPSLFKLQIKKDLSLRQDQKDAFFAIKENETGIVMAPTATGKSRIIAKTIEFRKVRTLLIVPKQNLQDSMTKNLQSLFGKSRIDFEMPQELKEKIRLGLAQNKGDEFIENHELRKKKISIGSDFNKKEEPTKKGSFLDDFKSEDNSNKKKFSIDMDAISKKVEISPEEAFLGEKKKEIYEKRKKRMAEKRLQKITDRVIKYKDVYIFCDQSLDKLPQEFLDQFQQVIIDECHHSSATMIRECLLKLRNAAYRYYFSATPWRDHKADQKLLASSIGTDIIYELPPDEAINLQAIAKPVYTQLNSPETKVFMKDKKKWRDIVNFGIVGNESRNKMIVDLAIKQFNEGENVFICVDEITHIDMLNARFKAQGIDVDIIHGMKSRKENMNSIIEVGERMTGIAMGTMSVGEGTDMPNLSVIILASGGKSSIRFLQRIGRGARRGTEMQKTLFKVFDFVDWFHPTLMRHSFVRKTIYEKYFKDWGE